MKLSSFFIKLHNFRENITDYFIYECCIFCKHLVQKSPVIAGIKVEGVVGI